MVDECRERTKREEAREMRPTVFVSIVFIVTFGRSPFGVADSKH